MTTPVKKYRRWERDENGQPTSTVIETDEASLCDHISKKPRNMRDRPGVKAEICDDCGIGDLSADKAR